MAYRKKHSVISDFFFSDSALQLQKLESQLCESVIQQCLNQGITVLTIHDSFVVDWQYEEFLIRAMRIACEEDGLSSMPLIVPVCTKASAG